AAQAGRVVVVERQHFADLFQAQAQLLEIVDLLQARELIFRVIAKALPLALAWAQQPETLVVPNCPWCHAGKLGKLADTHFVFHVGCNLDVNVKESIASIWGLVKPLGYAIVAPQILNKGNAMPPTLDRPLAHLLARLEAG